MSLFLGLTNYQFKKQPEEENHMERTYKKIEIVGSSETSFAEATKNAVAKACQSLRHVDWFEVTEMRGLVEKDKVKEFQVTVKIGFRLEEQPA